MVCHMKYIDLFMANFKKSPAFNMKDVARFLEFHGSTNAYSKIFVGQMVRKGRIYRLTNGFYTLYKNIETVGFPFSPFYYGLGFALTKHKLWKQQANPYIITIKNVRRGYREAFGLNYNISRISKSMFFGYCYTKGPNFYYPMSDVEKTLIDCIYYKINLEEYVYGNIFKHLDDKKMDNYLKRCNKKVRKKYGDLRNKYANET